MENASKALIIAGAILLAILLISLGIMIFNQAQGTVNNSGMSQAEITSFNNKFLKYAGKEKTKSDIKALANEILASNANESNANRKIGIWYETKSRVILDPITNKIDMSTINETTKYEIIANYCKSLNERSGHKETLTIGCIWNITIKDQVN